MAINITLTIGKLPLALILTIIAHCAFAISLFSQSITKAEIKKTQPSLEGKWSISMEKRRDKKSGITSFFVYHFLLNGKYEYQENYWVKSGGRKVWSWRLIETGKWILTDNSTLRLISDSILSKRIQPFDLAGKQDFEKTSHSSFKTRRIIDGDTVEYLYLRKSYNYRRKDY